MGIQIPIVDAIAKVASELLGAVDDWHTSDEEKLDAKRKIFIGQATLLSSAFEYEKELAKMKTDVITAEAKGESWIQRSWRPVTMLTFVALVVARWMGFTVANVSPELEQELMLIIQIGLGGYVVGRSAEKVAKSIGYKDTMNG